jgi:ketosteroid isomerase-like protein
MRHFGLAVVLLLGACASPAQSVGVTPAPVIAAERAFAARAGEIGWIPAFREFTAPDGQILGSAGFENAPQSLAQTPDDGNRALFWWPAFAGISRSGDIGFTAGPASFDEARTPRIYYFTIWRRQPDGAWKWIYDGGPGGVSDPASSEPGAEPIALPIAIAGAGSAAAAIAQVVALEARAANAGGLAHFLAADAHVYRSRRARAIGSASADAIVWPSADTSYHVARAEASEAGDMAFTLGQAVWNEDGAARQGTFARVWQIRAEGWRIVYDQLVIPRAPPRS